MAKLTDEQVTRLSISIGPVSHSILRCNVDYHHETTTKHNIDGVVAAVAAGSLQSIVQDIASLREPSEVHAYKIFTLKRIGRDKLYGGWSVAVQSNDLEKRIVEAIGSEWYSDDELAKIERLWASWEPTKGMARLVGDEVKRRLLTKDLTKCG